MAKMNAETRSIIQETQLKIIKSLDTPKKETRHSDALVSQIRGMDEHQLVSCMGETGGKIVHRFLNSVNIEHPELASLTNRTEWKSFSDDLAGLPLYLPDVSQVSSKHRPIFRELSSWCLKPHLAANQTIREELRKGKVGRQVVMKFDNENGYYGQPEDFRYFVRNSSSPVDEIKRLKEQAEFFKSFQMKQVADSLITRMKANESALQENYLGFQRITPINAAIVLAKIHGFKWNGQHVVVPSRYFNINAEEAVISSEKKAEDLKRPIVFRERKSSASSYEPAIQYNPRFYPLSELLDLLPDEAKSIVEKTESLSDLGGNPAFDYFWVVVPTMNLSKFKVGNDDSNTWVINTKEHTDEYQAGLDLDRSLIQKSLCTPVILGDHNGLTYFVCMFS